MDMAEIPAGSKFIMIDPSVPTKELKSARSNSKTEVYTIEDIAQTVGGSEYTETKITITSTQTTYSDGRPLVESGILDMGLSIIELLPAPGAGNYYDIEKIQLEYEYVSSNYTSAPITIGNGNSIVQVDRFIDFGAYNKGIVLRGFSSPFIDSGNGNTYVEGSSLNDIVYLSTYDGADPTGGDGVITVKIYHKTITFGS